ncbi:amidase [Alkalihalobacillus sp. BA299]|uniref:amidase n=1 Tax=Alkalihalobacillus sp. BA299 TaxID=2815938 RepID=UPI001AD9E348|nr:amidase [Alkalihalobacillus sp. BA299]
MINTGTTKMTITQLSSSLKKKEVSPVEVTQAFFDKIEKLDSNVKAWVRLTKEEALAQAKVLEEDHTTMESLPLFGIPFGVKDIIYTKGVMTSAGSRVNENFIPKEDATIVQKLKAAGSIVLGKTTTTEYASLGGPPETRNPWNLEHTPGGSSSGSAAALASQTAMFTLGTQTAGSLSRPASFNGLTVLKGTFGLVSRNGIIPASWSLDHAGAFTHTVEDTCLVYNELLGHDPKDPASLKAGIEKLRCTDSVPLQTMKIGVPQDYFFDDIDSSVQYVFDQTLQELKRLGVTLVPFQLPYNLIEANSAHETVMKTEMASYHEDMYQDRGHLYTESMQDLIRSGLKITATDYIKAQRIRDEYRALLVSSLADVDAIVTPAAPTPAPYGIQATGSPRFNALFTNAGIPTLTIPAGFSNHLPIGIQFAGRPLTEQTLINIGHRFQLETDFHQQQAITI